MAELKTVVEYTKRPAHLFAMNTTTSLVKQHKGRKLFVKRMEHGVCRTFQTAHVCIDILTFSSNINQVPLVSVVTFLNRFDSVVDF